MENDPTGALQALVDAEKLDPKVPAIHHLRALALAMKKDNEGALAEARRAVELDPHFSDAQNTLGKLLLDMGRYDQAIPPLVESAADPLYRDNFKPLTNLGIIYYRRGEDDRATDYLKRAADVAPDAACIAHYYLGHIALRHGRFPDAIREYADATKRTCAGFGDAYLALATAYERAHEYDLARRSYLEVQKHFANTALADEAIERLRFLP